MLDMILNGISICKLDHMQGANVSGNHKENNFWPPDEIASFGSDFRVVNKMTRIAPWENSKTFKKEYIAKPEGKDPFFRLPFTTALSLSYSAI